MRDAENNHLNELLETQDLEAIREGLLQSLDSEGQLLASFCDEFERRHSLPSRPQEQR